MFQKSPIILQRMRLSLSYNDGETRNTQGRKKRSEIKLVCIRSILVVAKTNISTTFMRVEKEKNTSYLLVVVVVVVAKIIKKY